MPKRDIHVVPQEDGWAVRREGAERDSSHHDRKSNAMNAARDTARHERIEVVARCGNGAPLPCSGVASGTWVRRFRKLLNVQALVLASTGTLRAAPGLTSTIRPSSDIGMSPGRSRSWATR